MGVTIQRFILATAAWALFGCGGGGSGSNDSAGPPPTAYTDPVVYSSAKDASLPGAAELSAVTRHQLAIGGATLAYTATAGHLTASNPATGAAEASFFYVAYTLDNATSPRPVTFFYNGGPGSATAWLHLGSFGPMRLVTGDPSTAATAPFPLVANAQSLLDVTDMVFVDAVGSGYSEAIAPNTNGTFWGVDADAAVFRDFVIRYVAANNRAASPKFLFGESYGTTRSAVLANLLESAGVELRGVVLQSSILNYNTNCGVVFVSCQGFLPSYAAVGAWYGLDNPNPAPGDLPAYLAQARTFAATQYAPAVAQLIAGGAPPSSALLATLVDTTGLALGNWQRRFNMDAVTYQQNLVPGTLIGLYDARVSAPVGSALASEGDPSSTFINAGFASGITSWLASGLGYTTPSNYVLLGNAIANWTFRHDALALPDTIPDLAAAMLQNPQLKVLSLNGYHDLVTPFFQTEQDLARLDAGSNVETHFYLGGHMTYLDDGSLALEKADLKAFYARAAGAP